MSDPDFVSSLYPFLSHTSTAGLDIESVLALVRESTRQKSRDVIALRQRVSAEQTDAMIDAALAIAASLATGHKLIAIGNGGSATDAQDAAADCLFPPVAAWRPLPAIALVNDIATITGVANDIGFENVFVRLLIAFGEPGDVVLAFSTSGRSPGVLAALVEARSRGLLTVALVGYDGGAIAQSRACDHCIVVRGEHVPRIQEAQATVWHTLLELVHMRLANGE